jgi:hypothetical protein
MLESSRLGRDLSSERNFSGGQDPYEEQHGRSAVRHTHHRCPRAPATRLKSHDSSDGQSDSQTQFFSANDF